MSIINKTPTHIIKALRLVRKPTAACKAAMVAGCLEQGAYQQWGEDLRTGTLWSALCHAECYEGDGHYAPGTIAKALAASLTPGVLRKAEFFKVQAAQPPVKTVYLDSAYDPLTGTAGAAPQEIQ